MYCGLYIFLFVFQFQQYRGKPDHYKKMYTCVICHTLDWNKFVVSKGSQIVAQWTVHADKTERAQFFAIYRSVCIMLRTSHYTYDNVLAYIP